MELLVKKILSHLNNYSKAMLKLVYKMMYRYN